MDRLRVAIAAMALLGPSAVFAFNAYISYAERGLVEPYDIPAAIGFLHSRPRVARRHRRARRWSDPVWDLSRERRRLRTRDLHRVLGRRFGPGDSSAAAR